LLGGVGSASFSVGLLERNHFGCDLGVGAIWASCGG
jgi:hypothetical protein